MKALWEQDMVKSSEVFENGCGARRFNVIVIPLWHKNYARVFRLLTVTYNPILFQNTVRMEKIRVPIFSEHFTGLN